MVTVEPSSRSNSNDLTDDPFNTVCFITTAAANASISSPVVGGPGGVRSPVVAGR